MTRQTKTKLEIAAEAALAAFPEQMTPEALQARWPGQPLVMRYIPEARVALALALVGSSHAPGGGFVSQADAVRKLRLSVVEDLIETLRDWHFGGALARELAKIRERDAKRLRDQHDLDVLRPWKEKKRDIARLEAELDEVSTLGVTQLKQALDSHEEAGTW